VSAGFDAAALDTVCDWRFQPATIAGIPVPVYYSLTVHVTPQFGFDTRTIAALAPMLADSRGMDRL
jgi:hypothetical protein